MSGIGTIIAPSRVGNFIFRGTVGSGAFSVVKLSYHEELKQFFACKIVPRNRINSDDLEQHFELEIRINQQMHHQGVVQIVDLQKDDLNYYIFMEFCPNGELFKYIVDRGRLSEPEAVVLLKQMLEALKYVHSLGVAHRDLKPENLLLDPTGRVKISDFGLSKFVKSSGLVDTPCGSPCYASPECLSGQPYDGRKSDVWSMGVIMFAMVTGQLPWTKRNQTQLFNQIKKGEYTIPPYLSDECQNLLSRLLTVDGNARITLDEALAHPWMTGGGQGEMAVAPNAFTMVSLKKVDAFFETNVFRDAGASEGEIARDVSQRNMIYNKLVKLITAKRMLPVMKARVAPWAMTQPVNVTQVHPPRYMNKRASAGKVVSVIQDANITRGSRLGRTMTPKLVIPHKPISRTSWTLGMNLG